jgi:hypothetical protein
MARARPALVWIGWSHALALALFAVWWRTRGRCIEFSELGWIESGTQATRRPARLAACAIPDGLTRPFVKSLTIIA